MLHRMSLLWHKASIAVAQRDVGDPDSSGPPYTCREMTRLTRKLSVQPLNRHNRLRQVAGSGVLLGNRA